MQALSYYRFSSAVSPPPPPPANNHHSTNLPLRHHHPPFLSAAVSYTAATPLCPHSAGADDLTPTDTAVAAFRDYQALFTSQRSEAVNPIVLKLAEGSLPADFPCGTYYLTGPGIFEDDHGSVVHPLDGHGYLRAFEFVGHGEVKYRARYIETAAKKEENNKKESLNTWRFTHRGPFSVLRGGKKVGNVKVMKNVANTSVVEWGGRLLCLWEGGEPYEVDPETLDTVGAVDIVGGCGGNERGEAPSLAEAVRDFGVNVAAMFLKPVLRGVFNMPQKRLLSHYKIDIKRNRLIVVSCNSEDMLLPRSNFTFYEYDSNFKLQHKREYVVPDHLMIHDWAFTDGSYIIFANRIKLNIPGSLQAVSGWSPMISALSVNPSQPNTPIYILPRFSPGRERDWKTPVRVPTQLWVLHTSNAFEERHANGQLEIQVQASACSYLWFHFDRMFGYDWRHSMLDPSFMNPEDGREALLPHLIKVTIKMDTKRKYTQCSVTQLGRQWKKPADFPTVNPNFACQRNSYVYAGTSTGSCRFLPHFPFDSVIKYDSISGSVALWSAGRRSFIGEPIFIPKGIDEDEGYILVTEYAVSKQRCFLVVLDANRIGEDALVAKFEVPRRLTFPLGFHGFWSSK